MRSLLVLLAFCLLPLAACSDRGDDYGDAMSHEHADDSPTATALSTPSGTENVVTEEVVYATVDGATVTGFLARPDTAAMGTDAASMPGIIVIHEWWGLNDNIRAMAEKLAAEGYVALAVDLYGGEVAETPEQARSLMGASMEREAALTANVTQAYEYLAARPGTDNVGVIGWCFGGGWSLRTALALPDDIDAAAIYYGQLVTDPDQLATLDMPILGIFGSEDQGIPVAQVRTFEQRLDSLGANATVEVYEGAGHAFANPSGERYVPEAAEDAWQKTLAFFDRYLKGTLRAPPAEESVDPRVELLGVSPGDTFAEARRVLGRIASSSSDGSMGSPPIQYTWSFRTNQGWASIYSSSYPSQSQDRTPVSTVVLEADVNDYSTQVVRRLYDDYKAEYSRRYGQNRPEKFDLGAIEVYRWTWNAGGKEIEIEYQQENDMPYSTKVKVESNRPIVDYLHAQPERLQSFQSCDER